MSAQNIFVLEYSPSQRAFHRQSLESHLKGNIVCLNKNFTPDYLIIATFSSYEESEKLIPIVKMELAGMLPGLDIKDDDIEEVTGQ